MDDATKALLSGDQQFWLVFTNLMEIFLFKLVLVFVAYRIVLLGYKLLVDGVKGEFKFKSAAHGLKADLASASPGTFFLLLGVAILIAALVFKIDIPQKQSQETGEKPAAGASSDVIPTTDPF